MAIYRLLPNRSELVLEARSSLHPIRTATRQLSGRLEAEVGEDGRISPEPLPSGRLEVRVEDLKAGNALYDRAMQDQLDTRRYPTIVAELVELRPLNGSGRYRARGDLTFHGATRRLESEVRLAPAGQRLIELEGELRFDVRDFGVKLPRLLMLQVFPDVRVSVHLVGEREA
jgi:polyisoprenoid-binding protein YceI